MQRRGDISALSWSGSWAPHMEHQAQGPPHPAAGQVGRATSSVQAERVTEWVNKETKRAAVLWALTLPRGLC